MATIDESSTISAEDLAGFEKTIENLIQGVRDPGAMDRAAKEMDEARGGPSAAWGSGSGGGTDRA